MKLLDNLREAIYKQREYDTRPQVIVCDKLSHDKILRECRKLMMPTMSFAMQDVCSLAEYMGCEVIVSKHCPTGQVYVVSREDYEMNKSLALAPITDFMKTPMAGCFNEEQVGKIQDMIKKYTGTT